MLQLSLLVIKDFGGIVLIWDFIDTVGSPRGLSLNVSQKCDLLVLGKKAV